MLGQTDDHHMPGSCVKNVASLCDGSAEDASQDCNAIKSDDEMASAQIEGHSTKLPGFF